MSSPHPPPGPPGPPPPWVQPAPGVQPAPWRPPGPAPLDQPQYDATLRQAVTRCWRKTLVFSGRASRSEFWWWYLVSFILTAVLQLVGLLVAGGAVTDPREFSLLNPQILLPQVWGVLTLLPMVALSVRRLHDGGRSGWWFLLGLPSWVGSPLLLAVLRRVDLARLAAGDTSSLPVGALVGAVVAALVGAAGSIVLVVFYALGPDPAGVRFDRRR